MRYSDGDLLRLVCGAAAQSSLLASTPVVIQAPPHHELKRFFLPKDSIHRNTICHTPAILVWV
jgi:hypothetical protein